MLATVDTIAHTWHLGVVTELNATSAALLGLLHEGPKTGGQLVAAATERFGGFFSVTRSQVYRELPALTDAGLLRLGKQGPRSSQQYAITAAGKRAFKSWLNTEPGPDNVRSPLILRLVHSGSLTPKQRAALVDSARVQYAAKLDEARNAAKATTDPYEKAAADFAVAHNRAVIKLLDAIPE
ncbi:PadR family transcriptional regulator [Saccharopolyspora erythraea NRRL 2338]|uniref:Helix-turn-helix transcriptional regulator n=1 Tax=Saccharopolyspora erythraea TaxID=1836 RepID=A0ABN1D2F6_SACER|nr:PadR family transcriptional regulator [Saccharopolyspora erythraea D]PFG94231.1 PadR family transcriptional regulator [Saccharopolyspora erythraea NRRL 2338]